MPTDVVNAVVGCCGSPEVRGEVVMQMHISLFLRVRRRSGRRCITDQRHNYILNAGRLSWSSRGICICARLAHVSDTRRPKCRDIILSGAFPELSNAVLTKLALADREARKQARREGHTHPIATGSAMTVRGKRIGHVQR